LAQGSFVVECLLALIESLENYVNKEVSRYEFLDESMVMDLGRKIEKEKKNVKDRGLALKKLLVDKFGYNLDEALKEIECGDDAPIFVQDPQNFFKI
jgi:hypothetical protein